MAPKRIAVIGSGASGITSVKCCLDEDLVPVCFERTNRIGGLWHYTENVEEDQACVMKSTVINTSKETMSYSDFPIPADFPMFLHHSKVLEYFQLYVKKFDLERHIRFNTEVVSVQQSEDFAKTGQWVLTVRDKDKDEVTTEVYDGVLVCTGHHAQKHLPKFEGMENFKGKLIHSHNYREHLEYKDKRVVVVGIGNSGADMAVELSRVTSPVYLSTRRGTWILNRSSDYGYPVDMTFIKRISSFFPIWLFNLLLAYKVKSSLNHAAYGLEPTHGVGAQHPTLNELLPNRIASGHVRIKPNVRRITATGVEFDDGSVVNDVDTIIIATGYDIAFPFIKHPAMEIKDNEVKFYKYVFPLGILPATLAVIGCIQPIGAIMPISEMQARWATRVFKGVTRLPTTELMRKDVREKREALEKRYVQTQRHTIQVDYVQIMDEMAEQFGAKPDMRKLLWKDPVLAWKCMFDSFVPYQYRLVGPGQWHGARQAIMTIWDRTLAPTKLKSPVNNNAYSPMVIACIVGAVCLALLLKWLISCLL